MAFPTVVGRATQTGSTREAVVSIIAGAQVGDFFLITKTQRWWGSLDTNPGGWTDLIAFNNNFNEYTTAISKALVQGDIDTGTVTINSGVGGASWFSLSKYLIRGAQSVEASSIAGSANPPSFSPSWGAKDTLWIAVAGNYNDWITGAPSGYSNYQYSTAGESAHGSAEKQLNAASEDPGAFGWTGNGTPNAATIAVQPSPPPTRSFSPGIIG